MGFVSAVLSKEQGIQWYYIVGLFIFLTLFIVIVYRTFKMPKADLQSYKNAILDSDEQVDYKK